MTFPSAVTRRQVTFGIPFELASGADLVMVVRFTPSRSMVWLANGYPAVAKEYVAEAAAGTQGSVSLPVTDQAGWGDGNGGAYSVADGAQTHSYAVRVEYRTTGPDRRLVAEAPPKNIVLPTGNGSAVDLDLMLPVETDSGDVVVIPPVGGPPTGGAGGFLSGSYPNPGVNAAALDAAVAAQVSDDDSATADALAAKYATKDDLAAGRPFQHTQSTPAAVWPIPHPFARRPSVEVYTLAGERVWPDVIAADTTSVSVLFPSPFTGYAVLS